MKQKMKKIYTKGTYVYYAYIFISQQLDEIQTAVLVFYKRGVVLLEPKFQLCVVASTDRLLQVSQTLLSGKTDYVYADITCGVTEITRTGTWDGF